MSKPETMIGTEKVVEVQIYLNSQTGVTRVVSPCVGEDAATQRRAADFFSRIAPAVEHLNHVAADQV
jgi:hypothetical protein